MSRLDNFGDYAVVQRMLSQHGGNLKTMFAKEVGNFAPGVARKYRVQGGAVGSILGMGMAVAGYQIWQTRRNTKGLSQTPGEPIQLGGLSADDANTGKHENENSGVEGVE